MESDPNQNPTLSLEEQVDLVKKLLDAVDVREKFIERVWYVLHRIDSPKYDNSSKYTFDELIKLSLLWSNVKYLHCSYSDEIMKKLANFYEKEVESMLGTLTTLIEPVVMVLLGLGVAIMVSGILLPIYNLAGAQ